MADIPVIVLAGQSNASFEGVDEIRTALNTYAINGRPAMLTAGQKGRGFFPTHA